MCEVEVEIHGLDSLCWARMASDFLEKKTKNITTTCIIITLKNIHTGYTVAYATDGLSPSMVSLA